MMSAAITPVGHRLQDGLVSLLVTVPDGEGAVARRAVLRGAAGLS